MTHRRFAYIATLITLVALLTVSTAFAHALVSVNGAKDANEWLAGFGSGGCPALPGNNSSGIYSSSQGCTGPTGSEFIWTDETGDQRTDHWNGTGNMDIKEFRLTGDSTNLNFLIEFSDITDCGSEYIAIAINSNDSAGTTYFPDSADTNLGDFGGGYERVIEVNTSSTGYWTNDTTFTNSGSSFCDATNNLWEISMPISGLGLSWPASSGAYDFAVAVFCNTSGGICDVGGSSDAMDVITSVSGNTWNEVGDGSLDYNFTMGFGPTAITLRGLTAQSGSRLPLALLAGAAALLALGGAALVWRSDISY